MQGDVFFEVGFKKPGISPSEPETPSTNYFQYSLIQRVFIYVSEAYLIYSHSHELLVADYQIGIYQWIFMGT